MSKRKLGSGMKLTAIRPPDGQRYDASILEVDGDTDSVLVCYQDDKITEARMPLSGCGAARN